MPYLIAHKVRGKPALDVAERCDNMGTPSDPGPWWIIPTSGHRAYPYWYEDINDLGTGSDDYADEPTFRPITFGFPSMPDDILDHYEHEWDRKVVKTIEGNSLLTALGLLPEPVAKEPLRRRV
jgi:hypothetical protein